MNRFFHFPDLEMYERNNSQSDEEIVRVVFTCSVSGSHEVSEDHGQQEAIGVHVAFIEIDQKMFDVIMF